MKGPKQVLRAATLWKEGVSLEQLPCFFDDEHARSKKLTEVPRLRRHRADTVRHPVLYVPGQCLEVRHGHVARLFCGGGGGGGGGGAAPGSR